MTTTNLRTIAKTYGTPLYVYDAAKIESQYQRLTKAFAPLPEVKFNFAMKALSNSAILKLMRQLGAGLDTVSLQEVQLGLQAGFSPDEIIFTPNGVALDEIIAAMELGVHINIDNLSLLEQFGARYPETPVCIRINPHVMAGGNSNISVGHIDSKFGISIHQMPHVHRIVKNTGMHINGLHMHTGSDILDIGVFLQACDILFDLALEFKDLEFIDLGSGFKVPYKPGDIATDVEDLGVQLGERFERFCTDYGRPLSLAFEPGKFLVSEAGHFVTAVNVVKQTTSTIFAQVNSGFNHLIRPMLYNAYHHIENLSNPNGKSRFYTVVGYICETDTFANNRQIAEIKEGDLLVFRNAGAYCFSMSSNYNSRFRPAEVLWYNNEAHLIRKHETLADLTHTQVEWEPKATMEKSSN